MQDKRNLAHRMGRWSGLHPWTAILGWIAFVAIAVVIGNAIPKHTLDDSKTGVGESGRATQVLDQAFTAAQQPAHEQIFVQSRTAHLTDAQLAPVVADATARLEATNLIGSIDPVERSTDGRSARLPFTIAGDPKDAADKVAPIEAVTAAVAKAHPSLLIEGFGDATSGKQFDDKLNQDFAKAEHLSVPITLIILIVAFGAL